MLGQLGLEVVMFVGFDLDEQVRIVVDEDVVDWLVSNKRLAGESRMIPDLNIEIYVLFSRYNTSDSLLRCSGY